MLEAIIIAGLSGFVGSSGRYLTGVFAKKYIGDSYPWGTFLINVIGCFMIGIFFGIWGRHEIDPMMKAFLITGFCGGFTTFSSFSHDMYSLLQKRQFVKFIIYLLSSLILGLAFVWLGMSLLS